MHDHAYAHIHSGMGIRYIRKNILKISQKDLASIAGEGTSQASVSRWETGELHPDRAQMANIRSEAERRGLPWNDEWFFTTDPNEVEAA